MAPSPRITWETLKMLMPGSPLPLPRDSAFPGLRFSLGPGIWDRTPGFGTAPPPRVRTCLLKCLAQSHCLEPGAQSVGGSRTWHPTGLTLTPGERSVSFRGAAESRLGCGGCLMMQSLGRPHQKPQLGRSREGPSSISPGHQPRGPSTSLGTLLSCLLTQKEQWSP